ncbi:ComEC/Rec2 family competence protein [Nonomuraea sp. NPDC003214]
MVIAILVCVAATAASIALRLHAVTTGPVAALAAQDTTVTAEITLTNDPKIRRPKSGHFGRDSVVAEATLESLRTPRHHLTVHTPITVFADGPQWRHLLPSQRVEVTGRLVKPTSAPLTAATLLVRTPPRILTPPSNLQLAAGIFRKGLRDAADALPPDQRGLLPALVVGDVSRIDPQLNSDLQEAGLSHLNAVSGANLAIVAGAALALSRLVGLPLAPRAAFAALAMLAFAVVARPSPSVLRALLMGLVAVLALGTGRAKDGLAALSVTVLLLILFAPDLAHSYGFALSVTATAGILLLAPRWRAHLTNTPTTAQSPTSPGPASTGPASTGSTPKGPTSTSPTFLGQTPPRPPHPSPTRQGPSSPCPTPSRPPHPNPAPQGPSSRCPTPSDPQPLPPTWEQASPLAPYRSDEHPEAGATKGRRWRMPRWVAEAIAVPAAAQAAVTPVLVLMSGQISLIAVPANLLAGPAVAPATLLGFAAALIAPVWPEAAQWLVAPAGYAVGWIILVSQWAVNVPMANIPWPGGAAGLALLALVAVVAVLLLRRRAWRTITLAVVAGTLFTMIALRPIIAPWPPKGWLMVMCDVGQGDGLVLAAGPGRAVVVDTGPDPSVMDACLRRLSVRDVPLVILTHPHADHVNGLPGVYRNRRVGAVVTTPHRHPTPQTARLTEELAQHRTPEWTPPPGTRWDLGPASLTVLAPSADEATAEGPGEGSVLNNASIVIHVRWRSGTALLSGDMESEAQESLLRATVPQADILKVPHHGSPRQVPAFFAAVRPRAALISVGEDNTYGHPAPPTLAHLRHLGARIYRTDKSGDLAVITYNGTLAVVARGR